jgi:hypothetical protein
MYDCGFFFQVFALCGENPAHYDMSFHCIALSTFRKIPRRTIMYDCGFFSSGFRALRRKSWAFGFAFSLHSFVKSYPMGEVPRGADFVAVPVGLMRLYSFL